MADENRDVTHTLCLATASLSLHPYQRFQRASSTASRVLYSRNACPWQQLRLAELAHCFTIDVLQSMNRNYLISPILCGVKAKQILAEKVSIGYKPQNLEY